MTYFDPLHQNGLQNFTFKKYKTAGGRYFESQIANSKQRFEQSQRNFAQ